jgi:hypothetical protein
VSIQNTSGRSRRHKGWQTPFWQVIEIESGPRFVTLHDARAFILDLPKNKQGGFWDPAIRCLLEAAETGDRAAVDRAKLSIQLAFMIQGQLTSG